MKVIETNISYDDSTNNFDFQSRVIEIENWGEYVNEIKDRKSVTRTSVIGCLWGESFPRFANNVSDFKSDNFHLSYSFVNGLGFKMRKLAYLINE